MVGGVGIGAGLLYLLDPDKGQKRRNQILSSASDLASSAKDYAGDAANFRQRLRQFHNLFAKHYSQHLRRQFFYLLHHRHISGQSHKLKELG